MSLNKAIEHGKEHRKQYEGRRLYEMSSRNHGTNSYKKELADYKNKKRLAKGEYMNIDITYCSQTNCKNTNCFRHQKHIPEYFAYVSIGKFSNCEYWKEKK